MISPRDKLIAETILILCAFGFFSTRLFAELPTLPGKQVAAAAPDTEELTDEFEDLLTDNPKPRPKKVEEAKKKKKETGPIETWGVDTEKLRAPASADPPQAGAFKQAANAGSVTPAGVLKSDLPQQADSGNLELAPVDWDLDAGELPPNEVPVVAEVAVILSSEGFYPSKVHLAAGRESRLYFTTTAKKPGALIIERLNIQRWIAKDGGALQQNDTERAPWEITKELGRERITEIVITPRKGNYAFYDALTGARGEIIVE